MSLASTSIQTAEFGRPGDKMNSRQGFTLIELMLVVAIIGLLAAIALPKFANLIIRSKEASTKGRMGSVRSAVSIYYSDNEGIFPFSLTDALKAGLVPKYLDAIPALQFPTVPSHGPGNVSSYSTIGGIPASDCPFIPGLGGFWVYDIQSDTANNWGILAFTCTHPDSTGRIWSTQ